MSVCRVAHTRTYFIKDNEKIILHSLNFVGGLFYRIG